MREMKESHIPFCENIPINWSEIPNKYIFSCHSTKVGDKSSEYQLLSLTTSGVKEKSTTASGGKVPTSYDGYQTVEIGDMIFCLFDLDCSAVFSGLSPYNGMITSAYDVLRANPNRADNHFLEYWFQYVFSNRYYKMFSKNIRYTVTGEMFNSIYTPIPPIEEQKKIGSYLDKLCKKVDALIANQEAQIEKLKAYKQSLITEVVTKGIDPNVPMKDSGVEWIEKIPEGWNAVPLKTLFDFGKGLPITKENLVEEGIPVISYGQIHAKWNSGVTIHEELKRFVNKEYLETNPSCLVKKGDFIIADTSEDREGCGNAAYVDTDDTIFAGYHTVILISKKPNVDNKYLAYLFLTDAWRSQLRKRVSGIKVFSVSRKFLSETSVLIPDNASKMVELLDEKCSHIDKLISIKQQKIERLNQYKKSIIYEYVTGKKEVQ